MRRLCFKNLPSSDDFGPLAYDPSELKSGIVHIGPGAFFRAHLAWYTHRLLNLEASDWRVTGVSLNSPTMAQKLSPQDGLYYLEQESNLELIAAVEQVLFLGEQYEKVMQLLTADDTKIISLTITEAGYCRSSDGTLALDHPQIAHDLKNPQKARSAIGLLSSALASRFDQSQNPVTVLSCDNLSGNGTICRDLVLSFTRSWHPTAATWIETEVSFPNSMVDRIVPAMSQAKQAKIESRIALRDQACLSTENFSQWVIEDNFVQGRPAWELCGAVFSDQITKFETLKLRLLNASHSAIAYLGLLADLDTVADAIAQPQFERFIEQMMLQEIAPLMNTPQGVDLQEYIASLISRFKNRDLQHRCSQIAKDGAEKLQYRIYPSLIASYEVQKPASRLMIALAAWIIHVSGMKATKHDHPIEDSRAEYLKQLFSGVTHVSALGQAYLDSELVPLPLKRNPEFVKHLELALNALYQGDPLEVMANA